MPVTNPFGFDTLTLLGVLVISTMGVIFVLGLAWDLLMGGDASEASAKATRRSIGAVSGAGSAALAAAAVGVDVLLQAPELLITVLGIGSIFAGVSWPMFGATAFLVWAVAEGYHGGPR